MDIFYETVSAFGQIVFGLAACYFLYKSMRGIKPIAQAATLDEAARRWMIQAAMGLGLFFSMILCSIDALSFGIVVVCVGVASVLIGLGALQYRLVRRRMLGVPSAPVQVEGGEVMVQRLQPDRIRGVTDEQEPVIFTAADLTGFEAVRGRVRMLNVGFASRMVNGAVNLPIMAFSNDDGDSFLIYKDDYVVPV